MPTLLLWPRNLLQDKVLWKTEYIGCAAHLVIGVLVGDVKYVIDPLTLNRNESIREHVEDEGRRLVSIAVCLPNWP